MWCNVDMLELLTEGSQADREKAFKQMGDGLYRCLNSMGEEQKECILINEHLIEDDKEWWSEQGNAKIDMELACKYQKVLEKRFYKPLLVIKQLDSKVTQLCEILRDKKHPELRHKKEDSEVVRRKKADARAEKFNEYSKEIRRKIFQEFLKNGCDPSFLEYMRNPYSFLRNNMLFNCRKGGTTCIRRARNSVNLIIESYLESEKITDEIKGEKIKKLKEESIKKEAREIACDFIFLKREWDAKLWMELIFLKFYKDINAKKSGLKNVDEKTLEERRIWIREESKKWFVEQENKYSWQFTEKAVMELDELEDKGEKLDLLNYTITLNLSMNSEINMIISHSDVGKSALGIEFGVAKATRGITKRLQQKDVKDMNPYVACLLWKLSNVSFERLFQIAATNMTNKDRKLMNAYKEARKPKNCMEELMLGLEEIEVNSEKDDFWYIPKRKRRIRAVCIELAGPEKIKITVEYLGLDTWVIELPYSNAMERIANMKDERVNKILELAEFETKESLMKYCADMVVRNYCREYFGISYEVFQSIKCYANVTITIYPLVFCKPDGNLQVGYVGKFMRNQGTRFGGDGYIEVYEKQVWQNREVMEKEWEEVRRKMGVLLKEEWLKDNAHKKYYSEYAMQQPDFFEFIYKEPYIIGESDAERIMQKIRSSDEIHW